MVQMKAWEPDTLPDLLTIYYKYLFPYPLYYKWLNYGGVEKDYIAKREFSFTLKDDIYIRYQSFESQKEMEREIQKKCPYKIDIGAVFSHYPKLSKRERPESFIPLEKEVVFDIDMTDYDSVRNCCSGANICEKCWPLMKMAVRIMDVSLRDDFNFEHLLWVYSGRRGVHCWVCDETARKKLSNRVRTSLAEYYNIFKAGDLAKCVYIKAPIYPAIDRAAKIISRYFHDYAVVKQDFLGTDERMNRVVDLISEEDVRNEVIKDLKAETTSEGRWHAIQNRVKNMTTDSRPLYCVEEIMLQYCYPRLDINVTKSLNHLLKSPFCIHPKTGRICVPFLARTFDKFNPDDVPLINDLCQEFDQMMIENKDDLKRLKASDLKKTKLKDGIEAFEDFMNKLCKSFKQSDPQNGKELEF